MSRVTLVDAFLLAAAAWVAGMAAYLLHGPDNEAPIAGQSAGAGLIRSDLVAQPQPTVPLIRVLLGGAGRQTGQLRIDGPYQVRTVDDFWVLAQGERLPETEVRLAGERLLLGDRPFQAASLVVDVRHDGTLWVAGRRYRGHLRIERQGEGLALVNVVPLEDYLASVVNCEMPGTFPHAAQQAQAIVSRTYALFHMKTYRRRRTFDVYDSSRNQNYRGMEYLSRGRPLAAETDSSRRAVAETSGIILTYRGRLFCTYYSAVCGGHTVAGDRVFARVAPPLVGVPCAWCSEAPNYRWQQQVNRADALERLADHLAGSGKSVGEIRSVATEDVGGPQVPRVIVQGTLGRREISPSEFRRAVLDSDTPSALFELELSAEQLVVRGRGWGHAVGMCQYGARGLAEEGRTCPQILAHYFPESRLTRVH